jgi:hypothetical protein
MRHRTASTLVAAMLLAACAAEQGPPPRDPGEPMTSRHLNTSMECAEWQRNADGTWTAIKDVPLATPNGPTEIPAGTSVREGTYTMGVDVAYALKRECGR